MLTFNLNNELSNIQQAICSKRKISDFYVAQSIYKLNMQALQNNSNMKNENNKLFLLNKL